MSLRHRSAVENAGADQGLEVWNVQAAVVRAGGEDHRTRSELPRIGNRHRQSVPVASEADSSAHEHEVRTEDPGLLIGLLGEPASTDAARKSEVVADPRARGRLPADPTLPQDQRVETLGCALT